MSKAEPVLTGAIPTEIGQVVHLTCVDLSMNGLAGACPRTTSFALYQWYRVSRTEIA